MSQFAASVPFVLLLIAIVACAVVVWLQLRRAARTSLVPRRTAIQSWGYQLQGLDMNRAAASPFDLLVIDPVRDGGDGGDGGRYWQSEIGQLKRKPDGGVRTVLAYLSIGEAESYRAYWQAGWLRARPVWLLDENPDWPGNFAVCFWRPEWQALMFGAPTASLDRILAAGFDGVYLDKCDVIDDAPLRLAHGRNLPSDMTAFIGRLSRYAKSMRPGFLVVMQNAEDLLQSAELRGYLDGIAKEELLFGAEGAQVPNSQRDIDRASAQLRRMTEEGKLALVVEYLGDARKIARAKAATTASGFVLCVAAPSRRLDRLDYEVLRS